MPPQISVVVPTFQRRASLHRMLQTLSRQSLPAGAFDVVVSIDGSDDGTVELLRAFEAPFDLHVISGPRRRRAAACNAGVRAAKGDLIILLDDDMEPVPAFVAAHRDAHASGGRRAVVGAAPMVASDDAPPLVRYRAAGFNGRLARLATPGRLIRFREAYTGNFSIPRDIFLSVGGFDEGFRMYGHEDYELAWRLEKAGVELVFSVTAVARQHYEKDFAALARDCIERGQTAVLFAAKHPEAARFLEVNGYRPVSPPRRLVRSVLLALSALARSTPEWIVKAVMWLERRRSGALNRCYEYSIDYFYWLGVRQAATAGLVRPLQEHAR